MSIEQAPLQFFPKLHLHFLCPGGESLATRSTQDTKTSQRSLPARHGTFPLESQ